MKTCVLALLLVVAAWASDAATSRAQGQTPRPNVLFIAVDDLRPQLGCYGDARINSPNIDALASRGLVFNRAYCQQAVCSPSRTSLLTGMRPDSTRVYDLQTHFRKHLPEIVTLPQQFKKQGYHAVGMGKIYHGGLDDADSWSEPWWGPKGKSARGYVIDEHIAIAKKNNQRGPAVEAADVPDNAYPDGMTVDHAIATLQRLKGMDKPFFLAVGLDKPHLPFNAPKKYWDLYERERIALADHPIIPAGAPTIALTNWGELRNYHGIPERGPLNDEQERELIHGYFACISYTDAQIGRVLDEMDRLKLRDNTIVILWGDHGWKLGEHGMWCKHTNFELDARAPLIISAPGMKAAGAKCEALVEFVDVYPSLCELAGLPLPEHLEGTSFAPLLEKPDQPWKKAAFSQYPRGNVMGYSMRTDRYRLTLWKDRRQQGKVVAVELYDHENDPRENVNAAAQPGNEKLVEELSRQLNAGWRAAMP